jgi:pseudaminic acid cytidylyltransferase
LNICVIPARGGSKRIPRKNIRNFLGKPMIAWSIEAAIKSQCFDKVICSTDDKEIAEVAKKYGAEVPFLRPDTLSNDYTTITPVIRHAIEFLKKKGNTVDLVCCIYATAPFILIEDIKKSLERIKYEQADYCFSVTKYKFPIQRSIRITQEKRCKMFQPEMFEKRSQDLEEAYHDAAQFYWGKANSWIENRKIFSENSIPYILPSHKVQDIDTEEDWIRAELMCTALLLDNSQENC